MRFTTRVLALCFLLILNTTPQSFAKSEPEYCDRAKSTADIMACVKDRHDQAQKRLNIIFDRVLVNENALTAPLEKNENDETPQLEEQDKSKDRIASLRETQNNWIIYRDQECAWEIGSEATESLKRIKELSCLTKLTNQRADVLSLSLNEEDRSEAAQEQTTPTPRWLNTLVADHPMVFWKYQDHIRADLDCDGEVEEIMSGLSAAYREVRTEDADRYAVTSVVSITNNPATGRPKSELFQFAVTPEQSDDGLCRSDIELSVQTSEKQDEQCQAILNINDGACKQRSIRWNGEAYELLSLPVEP